MVILLVGFILLWQAPKIGSLPYDGYYGEGFARFHKSVRAENIFLQSIFDYIEQLNYNSSRCIAHLKEYKASLAEENMTWAKLLLDSSGGLNGGFLSGNTVGLGSYDQCTSTTTPHFDTSYCLIKVELEGERRHLIPWIPDDAPIIFPLCVPASCSQDQLHKFTQLLSLNYNLTLYLNCQPARPTLTPFDIFILTLFACIWLITLSTVIPAEMIPINNQVILKIWSCFNIKKNLRGLLHSKKGSDVLSSLHGLKFIFQCLVTWYHFLLMSLIGRYPLQNKFSLNQYFRSWIGLVNIELIMTVDSFFIIAGLLLTYTSLKKKTHFHLFKYYIQRYMRLTPPLAACLLMYLSFASKLCNGPLCDMTIDNDQQLCRQYWWTNLLYINNFYPGLFRSCMPHTWYVAADWQLFITLSPAVVLVAYKWPNHLSKLIGAIFFSSILSSFLVSYLNNISTDTFAFNSNEEASDFYNKMYTVPHTRAGPWAIGMYLGIILHRQKNKPILLPWWGIVTGWLLGSVVMCVCVEITLPLQQGSLTPTPTLNAFIIVSQRTAYSLAIAWFIFAVSNNIAGPIGTILNWRALEPLGKISYSTYLIHKLVIAIYIGETRTSVFYSTPSTLPPVLGLFVLTFLAGFLLHLTFEAPAFNLLKLIFQEPKSSNGSAITQPADEASEPPRK